MKLPYWIFYKNKKHLKSKNFYSTINEKELILLNFKSTDNFKFEDYLVKDQFNNSCFYLIKN